MENRVGNMSEPELVSDYKETTFSGHSRTLVHINAQILRPSIKSHRQLIPAVKDQISFI